MDLPELLAEQSLLPLLAWSELLTLESVSRQWRRRLANSAHWQCVELERELDERRTAALVARIAVRHGASVERLRLIDCAIPERTLVSVSGLFTNLSELAVSGCRQLSDASFSALVNGAAASSLVVVRAAKCPELTDAALEALGKRHGESLERVDFSHCRQLTSEGVAQWTRSCRSLRSLALKGCPAANSTSLEQVAAHCPALETLLVGGAGNITSAALETIADLCPTLKALDISRSNPFGLGRGGVCDRAVILLASRCPELEYVNLGGQGRLSLAALEALRQLCPRLTKLGIDGCVGMTSNASDLAAALRRMPALQSLNLSFTPSEQAAQVVAENCAHLAVFQVDGTQLMARAA